MQLTPALLELASRAVTRITQMHKKGVVRTEFLGGDRLMWGSWLLGIMTGKRIQIQLLVFYCHSEGTCSLSKDFALKGNASHRG